MPDDDAFSESFLNVSSFSECVDLCNYDPCEFVSIRGGGQGVDSTPMLAMQAPPADTVPYGAIWGSGCCFVRCQHGA